MTRQQLWMVLARLTEFNPSNMTEAQHWAVESKISDGSNPGGADPPADGDHPVPLGAADGL